MEALTKKQQAILDYMKAHVVQHSYWPSIRDIQAKFRFASTNAVFGHLQALERKGVLQRIPGAARAYKIAPEVVPDLSETVIRYEGPDEEALGLHEVKIHGSIAAGFPDYTESSGVVASMQAPLPAGARRRAPESFALRVRGDSMIDEQIRDGDFVVVEDRRTAENGEMVIALLRGTDVTLKKFYRDNGRIRLQPANASMQPIYAEADQVQVQGVVVGVMRKY